MAVTLVVGAQWGDEGKGKIIDYLSKDSDYVVRFNGGNNAGHTVINEYGSFGLHLIPSGIFHKKATSIIANGVVVDLKSLIDEIETIKKAGISLKNRLIISPRCHVIMPYHRLLDKLYEEAKGKYKTGTTGRGIGPVYADKASYNGIRIYDLLTPKAFSGKLEVQLLIKNKIIEAFLGKPLIRKEIEKEYFSYIKELKQYIAEPYELLHNAVSQNKNILFEGAQGVFLDNDWGTYPFVTASTVISGGVNHGTGIPASSLSQITGVVKAYTTRVGEGPFPTELFDQDGENLRKIGGEFGTTTGRPRRCGWFDAELIRFAAQLNGFTDIAITKLDVLDSFKEIKICTGYTYKGKKVSYYDGDAKMLSDIKPTYKKMKGWAKSVKGAKKYSDLPKEAKDYLAEMEQQTGTKISYISTGPKRDEIIKL